MSKARLTYAGGKYAGKKIVDLLKSIKRVARNKKSALKSGGIKVMSSAGQYWVRPTAITKIED